MLHTVTFAGTVTVGVGLTVIVYVETGPTHVFAVGVTVTVPEIVKAVVLVAVNPGVLPEPLAPRPIAVLLLLQP